MLLVALAALFVALPLLLYRARTPAWRDGSSTFAPFTWQSADVAPRRDGPGPPG
ncbi:hypothetical protein NSA53_02585 [Cellulosimicrobium cellulans]|uniref:hypothetical protein n=1 Tax=Cellulosimicrobium cellulans TaxID=1710 RepID=UPI002149BAB2|nr:hypothetical protein [Cellulosimicrobium cellulans]